MVSEPGGPLDPRERADRHQLAAAVADADVRQFGGRPVGLVVELHHHRKAVAGAVDGRHLPAAESRVQRRAKLRRRDAERAGLVLVDDQRRLRRVDLQVAVDVGEQRIAAHRVGHLLRPFVELRPVEALHHELVLGLAGAAADPQVLHRHRDRPDAGDVRRVAAQVRQHLLQRRPLAARLQLDVHLAVVERVCRRRWAPRWQRRATSGRPPRPAAAAPTMASNETSWRASVDTESWPMSSWGNRPLGVDDEQPDRPRQRGEEQHEHPGLVAQAELAGCGRSRAARRRSRARNARSSRCAPSPGGSGLGRILAASIGVNVSDTNAEATIDDRHHHGELVEDAADDAAHQQHGNEHGHQRDRDRDDGEADLAAALERRLERVEALLLHVAVDVLHHHDGVVDDEADGERQAEQRNVVDAEVEQIHRAERGDQRDRHRQRRDDGRGDFAQEQEDHHDDQRDGQRQRELHVVHGVADRRRAVVEHVQGGAARQLAFEARQQRLDAVDHLDRVGLRLTEYAEQDRAGSVVPARGLVVLDRVRHHREVAKPHRPAVAGRDDDVAELVGVRQLGLRLDGQRLLGVLQRADRRVGVGRGDRRLHLVDADAARGQRVRIELDAHGVFLAAEHLHLRDAVDGRQRRRDHLLREGVHVLAAARFRCSASAAGSARRPD